jgi:hypothetical protein
MILVILVVRVIAKRVVMKTLLVLVLTVASNTTSKLLIDKRHANYVCVFAVVSWKQLNKLSLLDNNIYMKH